MIYWAILCFYYRCNSIYFTKESSELAIVLLKNRRLGRFRAGLGKRGIGKYLENAGVICERPQSQGV